jgi:hypothetical protein
MKTDRAVVARAVDLIDVTVHWRTHPYLHPTLCILAYRGRTKSDIDTVARTYRDFMSTRPRKIVLEAIQRGQLEQLGEGLYFLPSHSRLFEQLP